MIAVRWSTNDRLTTNHLIDHPANVVLHPDRHTRTLCGRKLNPANFLIVPVATCKDCLAIREGR